MIQSNKEFIPNFAKHSAILRKMTHKNAHFKWTKEAESAFVALNTKFKDNVLLQYFDLAKPIFLFTDAHVTGLRAMLAQGNTIEEAKADRATLFGAANLKEARLLRDKLVKSGREKLTPSQGERKRGKSEGEKKHKRNLNTPKPF